MKDQIAQFKQEQEKHIGDLNAWDSAYRKIETELSTARSRLASVQYDECQAIWTEVLSLENTASWAEARN